jgi:hypothetical protein
VVGITVNPGYLIVADLDGVVVVPKEHVDEVLDKALEIEAREAEQAKLIKSTKSLRKGIEQIAAARQGAKVGYLTRVGADTFGDRFLTLWKNEGIDTSLVRQDPEAHTGIYFITHTQEGHQFSYYRKGSAASLLKPEDVSE